ncbi:MAG TPA: hypothetical protein VFC44_10680 [Candidatus Saccharimonadales bacterium]|nr:hypothetical protein [Candidatus Saccharimonadales bacterium]
MLRCGWAGVQPDTNAAKAAHPMASLLDGVAFPGAEDGRHHGGQTAQKGRLAQRRQVASLRDFLKKLPQFLAGEISVEIGHEIFLDKTRHWTAPLCGIARMRFVVQHLAEQGYRRARLTRGGYEDEGPVLNDWRKNAGTLESLTLHCESDGDWISLAGYGEVTG